MHAPVREGAVWCELAEPGGPSVPCLSSQSFSLLQHTSAPCAPGLRPYGGPRAASATKLTQRRPLGSPTRLQPHPPAMNLIRGIDPDSYLLGGWQLGPGGLNTSVSPSQTDANERRLFAGFGKGFSVCYLLAKPS